jgi:hypothetical protein
MIYRIGVTIQVERPKAEKTNPRALELKKAHRLERMRGYAKLSP